MLLIEAALCHQLGFTKRAEINGQGWSKPAASCLLAEVPFIPCHVSDIWRQLDVGWCHRVPLTAMNVFTVQQWGTYINIGGTSKRHVPTCCCGGVTLPKLKSSPLARYANQAHHIYHRSYLVFHPILRCLSAVCLFFLFDVGLSSAEHSISGVVSPKWTSHSGRPYFWLQNFVLRCFSFFSLSSWPCKYLIYCPLLN